ncbi:unnamed protein product [Rhizophagus irregularis]|nr:unnamed protein product [Rhizophagus irregularis]
MNWSRYFRFIDTSNYLVLPNDNAKSLDKLKEKIVDYWDDEEKRPKEGCTHIIINSPRVIERRLIRDKDEQIREKNGEINELCEEFDRLMTKGGPNILKNAYKIGKIKMGDEVRYGKDHVCFLSAIGSFPYITYDKTKYYSINTFL